jgi:hypothetical protein
MWKSQKQIYSEQKERIKELESALEDVITGLEWRKENPPAEFDKADEEKLQEWKTLINNK